MEIGMGGTVAKMAAAGDTILSVVITDGRRAPDPSSIGPERMAKLRKDESVKAASILGVSETKFLDLESITTDENRLKATAKLIEIIDTFDPDDAFTLHPELDRHPSHRAAGAICLDALRPNISNSNIRVWGYEVWGLFPEWDRFEDISDQIEKKLAGIDEHKSQIAAIPYADGIAGLNRWRAVFADPHQSAPNGKYAEVFIRLK